MTINANQARELLETLAVNHAADGAQHGLQHASRLARLKVNSWQADIIRGTQEIKTANNPPELRALMGDPEPAVIFLPQSAMITAEIIERICSESSLNKMIIWETND
jgi:hypothetical protein